MAVATADSCDSPVAGLPPRPENLPRLGDIYGVLLDSVVAAAGAVGAARFARRSHKGMPLDTDWNDVVRQHGPRVFRAAWRILGHEADAEDVVQSVFLEAHRLWREQPAGAWVGILPSMATRRALDRLRTRRPMAPADEIHAVAAPDDPIAKAIEHELAQRLGQALGQLPPREAEVFCLRFF